MNIEPLSTDAPAIVYIDFKSPYAYLAVAPTRELERELGVAFDWRPFVLDIPSYLGSARLGKSDEVVEQNRSAEQWSGVKYAYYDCRRYARLRGQTIRGTEKIWDTNLIATAMLWARQRGEAAVHRFIDTVYPPFWVRELDVESEEVVAGVLDSLDLDGTAFLAWAHAEGLAANERLQTDAFAAGVYGVPTYVVGDERYFGREHLPRVRWQLQGGEGASPDVANTLPLQLPEQVPPPDAITVGIDTTLDSLLGLPRLLALLEGYKGQVEWVRVTPRKPPTMPPEDDRSRAAMHKRWRYENQSANARRYSPQGLSPDDYADAIASLLANNNIALSGSGPDQVVHTAMPGIAVLVGEELFIGRQHLPLLAARLGVAFEG